MTGKKSFTLIEIMVVVAILGLLLAIAVPNYLKTKREAAINTCQAQQRLIRDAIYAYMVETDGVEEEDEIEGTDWQSYIREDIEVVCPSKKTPYEISGKYNNPQVECTSGLEGH